jgi:hypothetical protein
MALNQAEPVNPVPSLPVLALNLVPERIGGSLAKDLPENE